MHIMATIKVVTRKLEVDSYHIIHATDHVILWLALACEELDKFTYHEDPVASKFADYAKKKLSFSINDPAYLQELAIATFLIPSLYT